MMRFAASALAVGALLFAFSCATAPAKGASSPAAAAAATAPTPAQAAPAASEAVTAAAEPAAVESAPAAAPAAAAAPADATAGPDAEELAFLKPYEAASASCFLVLEKAAGLVTQGKWLSAYNTMDDFDRSNADPFALAMKTSIVLRGAVRSDNNLSFALVDLEPGQDVEGLRKTEGGDYSPLALDPPALAEAQAGKGVARPGILSKELGDYYYDVLGRFSGQWTLSDEEVMARMVESYAAALALGVYDGPGLVNYAEALVRMGRGDESDALYGRAIELEPASANIRYSYAMSLAYRGKKVEALPQVDKALEAYGDDPSRVNAIALGAQTAEELGDDTLAQSYFDIAEKAYPGTPTPGVLRHLVYVETGNKAGAAAAADALIPAFGSNPSVIRTLVSTWFSAGELASARDFLQRNIAKGGADLTIATLNFYYAVLLSQGSPSDEDKALALIALDEAEARFKPGLGPDNQVFAVIDQMRSGLQPQAPGGAGGK